jgi:ABC-type multidrug transport system fused ATPase/permease subunit
MWSRIIQLFGPGKKKLTGLILLIFFASLGTALPPLFIAACLDRLEGIPSLGLCAAAASGVAALGLFGWGLDYFARRRAAILAGDILLNIRRGVFAKLLSFDMSFFDSPKNGAAFPEADIAAAGGALIPAAAFLVRLSALIVLAARLLAVHPLPGLFVSAAVTAALVAAWVLTARSRKAAPPQSREKAIDPGFAEALRALPSAAIHGGGGFLFETFRDTARRACLAGFRGTLLRNTLFPLMICLAGLVLALCAFFGLGRIFAGVSLGNWYLFIHTLFLSWRAVREMPGFSERLRETRAAGERLRALLEQASGVRQSSSVILKEMRGELKLENLSFSAAGEKIADGLSLHIPGGQKLAVAGFPSPDPGAFARLLARLYEYQDGAIYVDGHDIRTLDIDEYRQRVDFLPREAFLIEGTIQENIRHGRAAASDEEILTAAMRLGRGDWLDNLPDELAAPVEKARPLSPALGRLVAMARTLLKNPAICIIDEDAPSSDPVAEALLQEGLRSVMAGRTSVIIARRLATLVQADKIIMLHNGRIAEEGVHEELLDRKGLYAELYTKYFRHQSPDNMRLYRRAEKA